MAAAPPAHGAICSQTQTASFTRWIHRSPLPSIPLITVNQVIKPLNALPWRLNVMDWKIIQTNQDLLPVLALSLREIKPIQPSGLINILNQRRQSRAGSYH